MSPKPRTIIPVFVIGSQIAIGPACAEQNAPLGKIESLDG